MPCHWQFHTGFVIIVYSVLLFIIIPIIRYCYYAPLSNDNYIMSTKILEPSSRDFVMVVITTITFAAAGYPKLKLHKK